MGRTGKDRAPVSTELHQIANDSKELAPGAMKLRGLKNQAWVTAAVTDEDAKKSLILANSLKRLLCNRSVVILVSGKVRPNLRDRLHYVFDQVYVLEEDRNNANLKPHEFAKLSALTLKSFEKCVFVSPNMMFLKNADGIFDRFDDTNFACVENDSSLSIFIYKPSMESYAVLMKALGCRNGTPVASYIQNWFCNQYNYQERKYLEPTYNKTIALQSGTKRKPTFTEAVIVNFLDDPVSCQDWKVGSNAYLSMVDYHAIKLWMELYENHVGNLSEGLITTPPPVSNPEYVKEPIAIVGMSCRFPGSNNLEEFWKLLFNGEDGTCNPPPFRWLREQSSRNRPDCRKTNAGFLKVPVDEFDAKFFGISPKEVLFMDPQHRLLHELVWEGLEDAAIDPLKLRGSHGGVFIGSWTNDFKDILTHSGVTEFYRTYMGNSMGAAAARISFLLGLTGPSVATESGCSSAMVAVHLACRSLLLGETNLAIASGVNLLLHPFDKDEMPMVISPEGRCKTFSENADGFARAEGCGVLVLKRLSDAVKDGDHIWGLIRGSGVSQEGISRSMGTPTVYGESLAMKEALRDAHVSPEEVSYVETHGTGTVVGDPLEVAAIAKAYHSKGRQEPLVIGSVKTNVGHTESCSGITGIIKVVLAMKHEIIPPHRNFEKLNPNIDLESVPAMIPLQAKTWKKYKDGRKRLAGVSSFGITGTDSHVIVEEPPVLHANYLETILERPKHLLKISAKNEEALDILLGKYADNIESSENEVADIAYTANIGRASFPWRSVVSGKTKDEIVRKIRNNQITKQEVGSDEHEKICFLFTGQGSQYPGMAKQLYETNPTFQMHFDHCTGIFNEMYNINIRDVLWNEASDKNEVSRTIYSQTSIFCVEYALLKLWESWGIKPDYVLGHSLGEFCAAVAAGVLDFHDALKLVAERSRLIEGLPRGGMLVVKADKKVVGEAMKKFSTLDFAAFNGDSQTVVAGDSDVVMEFQKYCTDNLNLKTLVLDATHAFHSRHMDAMLDEYRAIAGTVKTANVSQLSCEYISGMRGCIVEGGQIHAEYWVQHTREAVNFLEASKTAVDLDCRIFIEIGPQPVLSTLTMINNERTGNLICLPTLKRNENEWDTILSTLEKLYLKGMPIDWQGFDQLYKRKKVRLPHYPFIGKKYWPDMMATTGNTIHPLLGSLIPNASSSKIFQNGLNTRCLEYVKDHAIGSHTIFPGAGYLEMALAAGHAVVECCTDSMSRPTRPMKIENLRISAPLALEESKTSQIQTIVDFNSSSTTGGNENDWNDMSVKIFHRLDSKWLQHASASFTPLPSAEELNSAADFDQNKFNTLRGQPADDKMIEQVYEKLASVGLKFGPIFQSIEKVWKDESGKRTLAKVKMSDISVDVQQYIIHPVILDCVIQTWMVHQQFEKIKRKLFVPISIGKFVWLANAQVEELYVFADSNKVWLVDALGNVFGVMSNIELIDTTVKAVESVIEQQISILPDMWEENWRKKPDIGPMCQRVSDYAIIQSGFSKEFQDLMEKTYNTVPKERESLFKNLEELVYFHALNSLYECNFQPEVGQAFSAKQLVQQLEIEEGQSKYLNWMLEIFEQHSILQKTKENAYRVIAKPPSAEEVKMQLNLPIYSELEGQFDPTKLINHVGTQLGKILKGQISPLSVLFSEDTQKNKTGSVSEFYDHYGSTFNVAGTICDAQRQRLTAWLENMDKEKFVMRIIEIGAGTGVFTSHVLPVIAELGVEFEYTYTDISTSWFNAALKRFENYKNSMTFRKLNIEVDPISQGFVPEYYDYAIASDVIHATKDVCQSLRNVRKLLRHGGSFDIMEQIERNRVITFIFGLMEGFWRMEDFRKEHCILTAPLWKSCLEKSGFEQVITFPSFNGRHGLITSYATIPQTSIKLHSAPVWLVFTMPECKLSRFITDKLKIAERQVIHVEPCRKYEEVSPNLFKLRSDNKPDFEQVMSSMKSRNVRLEGIIYLWPLDKSRVSQDEILQPYLYIVQTVFSLKQKIAARICAVTQGVVPIGDNDLSHIYPSTLWGFSKTFRNENTDMNCRCISITNEIHAMTESEMAEIFHEIWSDDKEPHVAYSNGQRYVARFQPLKVSPEELSLPPGTNRFQLVIPETKSIDDLQFGLLDPFTLESNEIEIQVKASALNFRDVLSVLKPIEEFKNINMVGFDFAGVVKRTGEGVSKWKPGDYVFGVNIHRGAFPSHIRLPEDDVLRVPSHITLCQAATIPAVFATTYHCLIDIAKVKPSDRVLIHTGSGGVGLSAIEVVKHIGAEIITTAGSKRKQNYLKSLGIKHVFHSRNTDYGDQILKVTNGRGVDVVLNSLTSEGFKEATLKACAKGARFVEMSKLSIWQPEEVKKLRPDVEYTIVDVSTLDTQEWRRLMSNLDSYLEKRIVNPIPYVRFDGTNIREALRYLQKAKHIGKVVCVMPEVRLMDGQNVLYTPMFNDRSTYLITGGLGGIGFEVCKWMIQKGAKHVLLASRRPASKSTQEVIDQINSEGANVIPVQLDIGDYEQCKDLLNRIESPTMNLPKLRGIMHAAGTLNDGLIANQDWSKLSSTFNAKVNGTLNLHKLTLGHPLEHFVLFSSVVALYGNPGQANHAAGNSFEDAFAHYRNSVGLPATTINWGQWGEVGVAVEVELPGMKALSTTQGISALELIMNTQRLQTCVMNMESFVLFCKLSPQVAAYLDERIWKTGGSNSTSMTIRSDEFWQQYDSKEDNAEKLTLIKSQLKEILRQILKLENEEPIEDDGNFQEMGVDSLMFVEIKNAVQSLLGDRVTVSASALRDCSNIELLSDQLIKLIEGDDTANEPETPLTPEDVSALITEDCVLPQHINAVGRQFKKISEIGTVLLTGSTGTLGPYILKELSNISHISEIYCLVRPSKTGDAKERLLKVIEFRDLLADVKMEKVKCVEGNIAKPKLGMDEAEWEKLVQKVDAIFHFAVKADHMQHYRKRENVEDVRMVNICGTKNVLDFACANPEHVKHVFYASSLLSVATTDEDGCLSESWPNATDFDGMTKFAYPISKFVGDVLMKTAALERGIPSKVFRLPIIAGDSKTGKFNVDQNHMMLRYLFVMKAGIMPGNPFPLALLPVDLCASTCIKLFFHPELSLSSDIINITHNQPDLDQEFPSIAKSFGYDVEFVEFSEFAQKLFDEPEGSTYSMFKDFYKNEEELMSLYTVASSLRSWIEGGVNNFWISKKLQAALPDFYPNLDRSIKCLHRDLQYLQREGWFEKFGLGKG